MNATFTKLLSVLLLYGTVTISGVMAQSQSNLDIALRYIEQNREKWELTRTDVVDMVVSDQYLTKHNNVTHIYFIQRYASIEVYNAIMGIHVQNGEVGFATNQFVKDLENKLNTVTPGLSAEEAVYKAAAHLGLTMEEPARLINKVSDREFNFAKGNIARSDINVKLLFQPVRTSDEVRLAWNVIIEQSNTPDWWNVRVDAITGDILEKNNWTVYCDFGQDHNHSHTASCKEESDNVVEIDNFKPVQEALLEKNMLNDNAQYNVFPVPVMSPNHGERELVVNPADPVASPWGWHDTNNQEGPEFTITRGNNARAYLDVEDMNMSQGDEPDGGEDLIFDFPFDDENLEPTEYQEAAVTQLFYMCNMIHDFTYHYGFDEAAGNFQQNVYGNGGSGQDPVLAEAQDGGGTNNANFGTPGDGASGRMQMYLWDNNGGRNLTINAPEGVEGQQYEALPASGWGAPVNEIPVTGPVVTADDGTSSGSYGCNPLVNAEEISGNIALIDRGGCEFGLKALNAENAGAIAVIICNFEEALVNMGAGVDGASVTIPAVFMTNGDCQILKNFLNDGLVITLQTPENNGPARLDGDFDNGIIAHEYGHGISNRLTGGPSNAGCLGNGEQMGEGWSDFMTLIMSVQDGAVGETAVGVGTYVYRQDPTGTGVRDRPYSTDMSINAHTYKNIVGEGVHETGAVWATMIWDLYWRLVEEYGYDPDLYNGTGGNNIAIQLVMDGMKLQDCNPGFISGRDAIIAADFFNNDGANECLIWEVFARRGLGWFADQGSTFTNGDGTESFEPMPECIKELKITKEVTPLIEAGDNIVVELTVTNHKEDAVNNVVVTDELLNGMSYVPGSITGAASAEVNGDMLTIELGTMETLDVIDITYELSTNPEFVSVTQFYDDMEMGDLNWLFEAPVGFNIWNLSNEDANSGEFSWHVMSVEEENDQILTFLEPFTVSGSQPTMRFFHRYNTQAGVDGGFIEVTTDGGNEWVSLSEDLFRNGYPGPLAYGTLALPNLNAFSGESDGFIATYVDLSDYIGQEINLRFRWGSDAVGAAEGWFVDDVELMDMFNYDGEACVTSEEGDLACDRAPERGTIVDSSLSTDTEDPENIPAEVSIFPNPATSQINIALKGQKPGRINIEVMTIDGKVLFNQAEDAYGDFQVFPVNVAQLPAGFYMVRVSGSEEIAVEKVIIE